VAPECDALFATFNWLVQPTSLLVTFSPAPELAGRCEARGSQHRYRLVTAHLPASCTSNSDAALAQTCTVSRNRTASRGTRSRESVAVLDFLVLCLCTGKNKPPAFPCGLPPTPSLPSHFSCSVAHSSFLFSFLLILRPSQHIVQDSLAVTRSNCRGGPLRSKTFFLFNPAPRDSCLWSIT
jgi:hypothetical protein